jgi:hypothetical protein
VTGAELTQLREQCGQANWQPQNSAQYLSFQLLAQKLTQLYFAERDHPESSEQRQPALEVAQQILDELAKTKWPADNVLSSINELAAQEYKKGQTGLFAYCQLYGRGPSQAAVGNRSVLLMKLVGVEEYVVLPVAKGAEEIPNGSYWLVMGIPQPLSFNISRDNQELRAMVVECSRLVEKPTETPQPAGD